MKSIKIHSDQGDSNIVIGEGQINVHLYVPSQSVFIITDSNVAHHQSSKFPSFPCYVVEAGEKSKSLTTVENICRWLLENGADRHSFLVGIGGGVVCDLAGFVASTFMRGIDFGFVATSLLAQVDASVGGKNGVNLDGYKNIIGTFNQPKFVLCDVGALQTLPTEEFSNGFAEIVKHTLISDATMFRYIEENIDEVKKFRPEVLTELVYNSVSIKSSIVEADEHEKGERKKLNLGHTWGHAIEKITGLSHGKSVSIGLEFAARLSTKKGLLSQRDYMRVLNVLKELQLPVCHRIDTKPVFEALKCDKKKTGNGVDFILMRGIGEVVIQNIDFDELAQVMEL